MRQKETKKSLKEKRSTSIMSKRISLVVEDIILPLGKQVNNLPEKTSFVMTEYDICRDLLQTMRRECPTMLSTRETLIETLNSVYDSKK